jgi:mono/diheme cytochrome c family protein
LLPVHAPPLAQALTARGDRAWLAAAGTLYSFDGARVVPTQQHGDLLAASSTGDAWLATDRGLIRYSRSATADDPLWQSQVAPIFQRVCAHCHLPGGEAGIDLSTPASWTTEHDEIARRVLVTRTMPPAGTDLGDADRAALEHWISTSARTTSAARP